MNAEDFDTRFAALPEAIELHKYSPAAILDGWLDRGEWTLLIDSNSIRSSSEFLKARCGYLTLSNATAVDWYPSEPRFDIVYHLLCHERKRRLRLKCKISGVNPAIESVTAVWSSAYWNEREIFDLFGVRFEGHSDLRRILLPEGWDGHPLRKDYPVEGYR